MGARRNVWVVAAGWCERVVGAISTAVRVSVWRVVLDPDGPASYAYRVVVMPRVQSACGVEEAWLAGPTLLGENTTCSHAFLYVDMYISEILQWQSSGDCFVNSGTHRTSAKTFHIGAKRRTDEWVTRIGL